MLLKYEINIQCILNYLIRGKRGKGKVMNEAEDRFIKPEIFKSGLTRKLDKDELSSPMPKIDISRIDSRLDRTDSRIDSHLGMIDEENDYDDL
jgi:hypothetical protein